MTDWPCVTAIVNTHLRPQLLPRALQSVANQTFTDFEVIVVHDGPMDDATKEVLQLYADLFDQRGLSFMALSTDEASGYQCVPKNVGIHHSTGDYIAFLDDDNEWSADHLALLVEAAEDGTVWPDLVYGRRKYVRDPGSPTSHQGVELCVGESPYVPWTDDAAKRLAYNAAYNFIDTGDFLVSRGALWMMQQRTDMMWNESLRRFADYELVGRGILMCGWKPKAIDAIVQTYHWTGTNIQLTRPNNELPRQVDIADVAL